MVQVSFTRPVPSILTHSSVPQSSGGEMCASLTMDRRDVVPTGTLMCEKFFQLLKQMVSGHPQGQGNN